MRAWSRYCPPEIVLMLALATAVVIAAPLNADTGYSLVAGRRMLSGDRLYVDMMETNPPMIFWISAALAFVGRYLPLSDARLMGSFVAVTLFVCTAISVTILIPAEPSRPLRFCMLSAFLSALILPFIMWTGQREQVAAILMLPYTLVAAGAARDVEPRPVLAICCGVLAAVGLAIKPFFLAAWIACELAVLTESHHCPLRRRMEFWTVVLLQCAYAAAVLTLTRQYVTTIVPLARAFYGAYGINTVAFARDRTVWILGLVGILAIVVPRPAGRGPDVPFGRVFGAATLGWLAEYVVQGKGWYYHLIPAVAFGAVAVSLTAASLIARLRERPRWGAQEALAAAALLIVIAAAAKALPSMSSRSRESLRALRGQQPETVRFLAREVEQVALGEPVYFLATDVWPAFPVVNLAGATWPYHYHFLWPIPALYARRGGESDVPYRAPDVQGPLERRFFDTVVDDLTKTPPRVLVVARSTQLAMGGRRFDFVEYFSGSPAFRKVLAQYSERSNDDWAIYERIGP